MQHNAKGGLHRGGEGLPIPRENIRINGINCLPETFAPLCLQDRLDFGKASDKKSVDTHQYILSFAPGDKEKGLTMEEAHRFGYALAKRNFPGHRVLVCTHPEGEHKAGNIHVHIVVSALRFQDRPADASFMRLRPDGSVKPSEYRAGCAHQDTAALRKHLLAQINTYCQAHGYAVCPEKAARKISDKEYLVQQQGKEAWNDQLRRAVSDAAASTQNWEAFTQKLKNDYTYTVPVFPPIPYPARQKMWNDYNAMSKNFWEWEKRRRTSCQGQLDDAFQELKKCNSKAGKAELGKTIRHLKESRSQLGLYKKVFQTYARAASWALRSHNQEEAAFCLEQMQELTARQTGYWQEGFAPNAGAFSLVDGPVKSRITWKQLTQQDLIVAQGVLNTIQDEANRRKEANTASREIPMPIEVKLSRGEISFKHPAAQRWVRGKRLGEAYTLKALGISPPRVSENHLDREIAYSRGLTR